MRPQRQRKRGRESPFPPNLLADISYPGGENAAKIKRDMAKDPTYREDMKARFMDLLALCNDHQKDPDNLNLQNYIYSTFPNVISFVSTVAAASQPKKRMLEIQGGAGEIQEVESQGSSRKKNSKKKAATPKSQNATKGKGTKKKTPESTKGGGKGVKSKVAGKKVAGKMPDEKLMNRLRLQQNKAKEQDLKSRDERHEKALKMLELKYKMISSLKSFVIVDDTTLCFAGLQPHHHQN